MELDRQLLVGQLERLKPAFKKAGKVGLVPEFNHVWFDKANLSVFDGKLGIRVPLETDLAVGVPSDQFLLLLQSSDAKQASLGFTDDGDFSIKLGRSRARLATLPPEQSIWGFPPKPDEASYELPVDEALITALSRLLVVKTSEPTRVEHNGIVVYPGRGLMALYATDTKTMGRCPVKTKGAKHEPFILPRPFVEQVVKQCSGEATIYLLDSCLMAIDKDIRLYSNLLDTEDLADLPSVMSKYVSKEEPTAEIPRELPQALERVKIMAGKEEPLVRLTAEEGQLSVRGDFKLGDVRERIKLNTNLEGSATVVVDLVQRALADCTHFSITEQVLTLHGADGFCYLVASR